MIESYFTRIAVVRLAARLAGRKLYDNYAFHGALPRFSAFELGNVSEVDGIEDVPEKAENFRFGLLCGKVLHKYLEACSAKEMLKYDACTVREIYMDITPEKMAKYTPEQLRENVGILFKALFKRAQIRTHTAKPGSEDINAWITRYYAFQKDYEATVSTMADAVLFPDSSFDAKGFYNSDDEIIALALREECPDAAAVSVVLEKDPSSVFGKMLCDILKACVTEGL